MHVRQAIENELLTVLRILQDCDLHNGVLHGLGIVTVDAAKLSGAHRHRPAIPPCEILPARLLDTPLFAAEGVLWVGEIPDHLVANGRDASDHLRALFSSFGEIVSITVRTKPGTRKSWAMLSFTTEEAAVKAIEVGVTVDAEEPGMEPYRSVKICRVPVGILVR